MQETTTEAGPKPVKLPYFHRTLSPQDAALIGDITPKPIDKPDNNLTTSGKLAEGSAWNSAKTWEERDCTSTCKDLVKQAFSAAHDTESIQFSKVDKVDGHSSITHVRGRARYMYEWTVNADFKVNGNKGTATISDLINDQLEDIELEIKWKGTAPARAEANSMKEALKKDILRRMAIFEENFRKLGN